MRSRAHVRRVLTYVPRPQRSHVHRSKPRRAGTIEPGTLPQSRARLACVQRARARPSARPLLAGARTDQIPRHLRLESGRVLHDSRLGLARATAVTSAGLGARWFVGHRAAGADSRARRALDASRSVLVVERVTARAGEERDPCAQLLRAIRDAA